MSFYLYYLTLYAPRFVKARYADIFKPKRLNIELVKDLIVGLGCPAFPRLLKHAVGVVAKLIGSVVILLVKLSARFGIAEKLRLFS